MSREINITLTFNDAYIIRQALGEAHGKYWQELNNEVADILQRVELNTKSRGIFGATGQDYFNNNKLKFERLKELAKKRRDLKYSINAYSKACKQLYFFN